jgi:hypothetical protein
MNAPIAPVAAAPASRPATLEAAFASARAAARASADPASVLRDPAASVQAKLDALDALQDRIPEQKPAAQAASLDAIGRAAADAGQPAAVRAKALTLLGYAVPPVENAAARERAIRVLLAALREPAFRLFVLRGLGPAAHGLPPALEPEYENALLDLLDGPIAGEERETALVALSGFVSGGEDMPKRAPQLLSALDARLLAPIEADPAAFARDPRSTPASRELTAAVIWIGARHRAAAGDPAPAARVKALLARLIALEPDAGARAWYASYRDADPPKPLTAKTTSRAPGSDEP